jgi:hypothetical protein
MQGHELTGSRFGFVKNFGEPGWGNAYPTVFRQGMVMVAQGINHPRVFQIGRSPGQGDIMDVVVAQKIIYQAETIVVFGHENIEQLVILVPELNARDGFNVVLLAFPYKINDPHGGIDIGKCQLFDTLLGRLLHQVLY